MACVTPMLQQMQEEMEAKMRKQFEAELAKLKAKGDTNQEEICLLYTSDAADE